MNPDPNQPQGQPVEMPTPEVVSAPVVAPAPVADTFAPNPFGAAPVSSEPAPLAPVAPVAPMAPVDPLSPVVAPMQPTGTIGSSPNANPVANFLGNPKKKKLITLIGSIVGGLIVLGIIAVVVFGLFFPTKADYRAAATQFNAVSSAYSNMSTDATMLQYDTGSSTTDTQYENNSESLAKSLQDFKDENTKLAKMKAVKVGEGQKLYSAYESKVTAFATYADDLLVSLKSFRPIAKACGDISTSKLLSECIAAVDAAGDIPNADLKQFLTELGPQYKALQGVMTGLAAIPDSERFGKQYENYKALRDQTYDIQAKVSSASKDYRSNATKHANDIDPAKTANALGEFLMKKANG